MPRMPIFSFEAMAFSAPPVVSPPSPDHAPRDFRFSAHAAAAAILSPPPFAAAAEMPDALRRQRRRRRCRPAPRRRGAPVVRSAARRCNGYKPMNAARHDNATAAPRMRATRRSRRCLPILLPDDAAPMLRRRQRMSPAPRARRRRRSAPRYCFAERRSAPRRRAAKSGGIYITPSAMLRATHATHSRTLIPTLMFSTHADAACRAAAISRCRPAAPRGLMRCRAYFAPADSYTRREHTAAAAFYSVRASGRRRAASAPNADASVRATHADAPRALAAARESLCRAALH